MQKKKKKPNDQLFVISDNLQTVPSVSQSYRLQLSDDGGHSMAVIRTGGWEAANGPADTQAASD